MSGWIKLHRQIVTSSKFADPDILRLWILCLTKAAHKDSIAVIDKREILLTAGQFITGRYALHHDYNALLSPRKRISETTLWSWLKRLENWGDLDIKTTNKYSVVTVLKWSDYQETLTANEQQIDSRLTTDRQQIDTNKNVKNLKNDKNVINISTTTTEGEIPNPFIEESIPNPFKLFESEGFGTISSITADKLGDMIDTYSERWVVEAMKIAVLRGKRTLGYVEGILKGFKSEGVDEPWNKAKDDKSPKLNQKVTNFRSKPQIKTVSSKDIPSQPISKEEYNELLEFAQRLESEKLAEGNRT